MIRILFILFFSLSSFWSISQPPIVYLKNKKEFAFHGKPGEVQSITIIKNLEILILTKEGVEMFENFTFPDPIDPIYQDLAAPIKNHHNHFFIHKVNHFDLRVKRNNTYIATYKKINSVTREKYLDDATQSYNASYLYHLNVKNVAVGDLIRLNYEITIPYEENQIFLRSMRIFLDELYPSEETELKIRYHDNLNINLAFQNGGNPQKSYGKDDITLKWNAENLPGALSELNGRPYKSLPYIEIFINNARIYWPAFYRFYVNHMLADQMSIKLGSTSKQYQLLDDFNKITTHDSEPALDRIKRIANQIALHYKYDNDSVFFNGNRLLTMPKFGYDIGEKRLRESNKVQLYNSLIFSSGLSYGALFLADVRTAELSKHWMQPIYLSDFMLLPFTEDESALLYPKSQQCGFFVNEYPYYFENAKAEFIPVNSEVFDHWQSRSKKDFNFITLPESKIDSNTRYTVLWVQFDKNTNRYKIEFEMTLKGQFSTSFRPLYLCNEHLLHSHPIYHKKLWDDSVAENIQYETNIISTDFPFTTKVKGTFDLKDLSLLNIHPTYSLDSNYRTLPFYSDFVGIDNAVIRFEEGALTTLPEEVIVRNEFGRYILKTQIESNKLTVYSSLSVLSKKVDPENFKDVTSIYNAAKIINKVIEK